MTAEIVKQKWKNLRDSYMKYLKYLKGSTGSGKKYENWPWAAHLEFLRDTVAPRATTSNVSVSQIHETSITDEDYEPGESDSGNVTSPTQMPPPKRTTKRKELTEDVAAVLGYLEKKNSNKTHTKLDHIDNLFLPYAHTFKTFSPRTQAILKMEMSQLFGRAELNEVDGHNSTRSSPMYSTTSSWSDVNSNQAAENDTGNTIQALNYSNVYTDVYTREADNDTRDSIQGLNYSNIHTHPKSTNSLVLGSYPVRTQSTKDLYENVSMFLDTQPKNNY